MDVHSKGDVRKSAQVLRSGSNRLIPEQSALRAPTTSCFANGTWHREFRLRLSGGFNRDFLPGYGWHLTHRCHQIGISTEVWVRSALLLALARGISCGC